MREKWLGTVATRRVARALLGDEAAESALSSWLDEQRRRVEDPAFASSFTDHLDLPGISAGDCNHRLVEGRGLRVLGGIRFYGRDVARPFVEIVAWTRLGAGPDTLDEADCRALQALASREWSAFAPISLRLACAAGAADLPARWRDDTCLDVSVHVARVDAVRPDDGSVTLERFDDASEGIEMVKARYARLREDDPALARDVTPAAPPELERWHAAGSLHAIRHRGETVGAIATERGEIEWLPGHVVMEEVVATRHSGRGFAAAAQRSLAAHLLERRRSDGAAAAACPLLIGTIDGRNIASRRSATSAGRAELWRHVFLPLTAR